MKGNIFSLWTANAFASNAYRFPLVDGWRCSHASEQYNTNNMKDKKMKGKLCFFTRVWVSWCRYDSSENRDSTRFKVPKPYCGTTSQKSWCKASLSLVPHSQFTCHSNNLSTTGSNILVTDTHCLWLYPLRVWRWDTTVAKASIFHHDDSGADKETKNGKLAGWSWKVHK